jgi:trehalose 6-phosphate phosphatase
MKPAFSPEGLAALRAALRLQPLLAFDFDGTLAPIVAHPDDARVSVLTSQRLAVLARRHPVAIVTGRAVADVARRLGFTPQYIVGNHGAEDLLDARRPLWQAALDGLRSRMAGQAQALAAAGVQAEDKKFSLALHYRLAPDQNRALRCIEQFLEPLEPGLATVGGKCVVNVVAAGAPDKGDAVASLVRRSAAGAAVFVGDDINDEAVFEKAPAHWVTVRVGREPAPTRAAFRLHSPRQVATWLRVLAEEP